jgi:hypothetical protein
MENVDRHEAASNIMVFFLLDRISRSSRILVRKTSGGFGVLVNGKISNICILSMLDETVTLLDLMFSSQLNELFTGYLTA